MGTFASIRKTTQNSLKVLIPDIRVSCISRSAWHQSHTTGANIPPTPCPSMSYNSIPRVACQGVNEAVSACKGEVYVVTTKQQRFASALLEHAGEDI